VSATVFNPLRSLHLPAHPPNQPSACPPPQGTLGLLIIIRSKQTLGNNYFRRHIIAGLCPITAGLGWKGVREGRKREPSKRSNGRRVPLVIATPRTLPKRAVHYIHLHLPAHSTYRAYIHTYTQYWYKLDCTLHYIHILLSLLSLGICPFSFIPLRHIPDLLPPPPPDGLRLETEKH